MKKRGCGVIFYNRRKKAVLLFRRDNKDWIPFPNMLDILGGHVEEGETPEAAIVREMAEELLDIRTNSPYVLQGHERFIVYDDERGCEQHVFNCFVDFEISDLKLLEGRELVWLTEQELGDMKLAFDFELTLKMFFSSSRAH